ncbi:MAG: hypothetical protein JXA25_19270 [Anaerolineales bacterium]|nr:hypothetical protein [Anaerolineales bacterium]
MAKALDKAARVFRLHLHKEASSTILAPDAITSPANSRKLAREGLLAAAVR